MVIRWTFGSTAAAFLFACAPAHADGPLTELLETAPTFELRFLNAAENSAILLGGISIDLGDPLLSLLATQDPDTFGQDTAWQAGPETAAAPGLDLPTLTTSVTGVSQTGRIDVIVQQDDASLTPVSPPLGQVDMTGSAASQTTPVPTDPMQLGNRAGIVMLNSVQNTGDLDGSVSVRSISQDPVEYEISTSASGSSATGTISIVIGSD